LEYCTSEGQIADILTKGVTIEVFKKLRSLMDVESLSNMK